VQERLEVLYGNQATFNIVSNPGRGTIISIEIPASLLQTSSQTAGALPRAASANK
jgi:hypothetical protein